MNSLFSEIAEIHRHVSRMETLLRATYNLLKKQEDTPHVLNMLETTVEYDGTECDGSCLMEDIACELGIYEVRVK